MGQRVSCPTDLPLLLALFFHSLFLGPCQADTQLDFIISVFSHLSHIIPAFRSDYGAEN